MKIIQPAVQKVLRLKKCATPINLLNNCFHEEVDNGSQWKEEEEEEDDDDDVACKRVSSRNTTIRRNKVREDETCGKDKEIRDTSDGLNAAKPRNVSVH